MGALVGGQTDRMGIAQEEPAMIWRSSSKPRRHLVSARSDTCFFRMLWTRRRLIQLAIHCCGEEVLAAIVSEVLAAM